MGEFPVARGAWLPIDAAAELLRIDAAEIRRWVAEGALARRVVEGVEFVPLHELNVHAKRSTQGKPEPQRLEEE
ncbi:MAG TPA: hypothetical protein VFH11_10785 [Gemmatimonadota bacterium]|nr:hypothetical protein [Gemmatimonadota bacterium]